MPAQLGYVVAFSLITLFEVIVAIWLLVVIVMQSKRRKKTGTMRCILEWSLTFILIAKVALENQLGYPTQYPWYWLFEMLLMNGATVYCILKYVIGGIK